MIRVLVAEDSPTIRELLLSVLQADPAIEIVGIATDGLDAIEQTKAKKPDVITMDVRMPLLDGLEATALIMVEAPTPIVIISSTIDPNDVTTAMQALRSGALTALPKLPAPSAPSFAAAARALVDTVKTMSQVKVVRRWPEPSARKRVTEPAESTAPSSPRTASGRARLPAVVAIAASTGGPAALHRILSDLPESFAAPLLIVQHMSHGFIGGVADWLNEASALRVKVAEHDEPLAPGVVYLAPDDRHLGARKSGRILLSRDPPIGGFRPSGDYLFKSVADSFGLKAVAVVLTGMGHDGASGLAAVRSHRGRIVAQDEASSVVYGMPAAAVAGGPVDCIASFTEIAHILVHLVPQT